MNRIEFMNIISETYGTEPECPWRSQPTYAVFRHTSNRKWFAVIMDICESKLLRSGERTIGVVNLKCDPIMIGSLRNEKGIYPAFHMNKSSWITAVIDEVDEDALKMLVSMSYSLTAPKVKARKINE